MNHSKSPDVNEELSKFFTKLYKADENAVLPGKDYKLNLQGNSNYIPIILCLHSEYYSNKSW